MKWIAIMSALLLGACAQQIEISDHEACDSYGLKFGTPDFAQCMMQKDEQRNANRALVAGALLNNPNFLRTY